MGYLLLFASKMEQDYHPSQVSSVGWYIASYIQRTDPVSEYESDDSSHEPWAIWENRILVRAFDPAEALRRAQEHLAKIGFDYTNTDGVLLRVSVAGLTSLLPICETLEDGNEIEWIDHTGESIADMLRRVRDTPELEAFTLPEGAKPKPGEQDEDPKPDNAPS